MNEIFSPDDCDGETLLRKQKSWRRKLLARDTAYIDKRIAILSGSTTDYIRDILEIFLLAAGIRPQFYQSEYNKFYEDAVFTNPVLTEFKPDLIVVFTASYNIIHWPDINDDESGATAKLAQEQSRFTAVWDNLRERYGCAVLQTNFDFPAFDSPGNLSAVLPWGKKRFVSRLNEFLAQEAAKRENFYLVDLHGLAARIGLAKWHDPAQYAAYKLAASYECTPEIAKLLAQTIKALWGKSKKCLVLDLDDTLWGGIIGDEGVQGIKIGRETAVAESFTAWQTYVKNLRERGIILAVCSKNETETARSGFSHPDSVLKYEDFAAFRANWCAKDQNIRDIATELNIGLDSMVFIDDNPAERELVRIALPEVVVPRVTGGEPFSYIRALEEGGYFTAVTVSQDDRQRNEFYRANHDRREAAADYADYDDFLRSLDMTAEIAPFKPIYFDRIAQLTNKSNQFNLTTRRYTRADIERMTDDDNFVTLYGRLKDKFGDNGLVAVIIGEKKGESLDILLWLMSCRVLKRGMEQAMLDALAIRGRSLGINRLSGRYIPTAKNKMVAELYGNLGFDFCRREGNDTLWELNLTNYEPQNKFIKTEERDGDNV